MKNKIVALDIGEVCMHVNYHNFMQEMGFNSIPEGILDAAEELETGIISENRFIDIIKTYSDKKLNSHEIIAAWNAALCEDVDGMPELVKEMVDCGFKFVFFSDTSTIHRKKVYEKLSFASLVSDGVFSFEAGAKKPDREMYCLFEKRHGKPCLYIDDKPSNIESGRLHGWNSHLFTSAKDLKQSLQNDKKLN